MLLFVEQLEHALIVFRLGAMVLLLQWGFSAILNHINWQNRTFVLQFGYGNNRQTSIVSRTNAPWAGRRCWSFPSINSFASSWLNRPLWIAPKAKFIGRFSGPIAKRLKANFENLTHLGLRAQLLLLPFSRRPELSPHNLQAWRNGSNDDGYVSGRANRGIISQLRDH